MKIFTIAAAVALVAAHSLASAADGLIEMKSPYSVNETVNRLEKIVRQRGLTVFARIDHAGAAASVDQTLRPTELLIFGAAKGDTPLMLCAQTAGIDLPLKALVWQDSAAQVWLGYNDPVYLARRHNAPDCPATAGLRKALDGMAEATLAP